MQTFHSKNNESVQKKTDNTASTVLDKSSQSEALQRKADMANGAAQRVEAPRPNNTGLPDNLKSGIESLSGFSMDDVRVHYNSSKPATVQALAYTQGTDIHVAPGQEKHLPHEAWHVAQQMAGRVSSTTNINGMPVNDNADLEHEADVMGEKAVQCKENAKLVKQCILNQANECVPTSVQCFPSSRISIKPKNMIDGCPSSISDERYRDASRSIGLLDVLPSSETGNVTLVDGSVKGARVDYQKVYNSQDGTKRFYNIQVQANRPLPDGLEYPVGATKRGTSLSEVEVEKSIVKSSQPDVVNRGLRLVRRGLFDGLSTKKSYTIDIE